MMKQLIVMLLLATSCSVAAQGQSGQVSPQSSSAQCELDQDDYAVYTAFIKGLHGPEDPEEAWEGKEILILDVTAAPKDRDKGTAAWGFRSTSKAAPSEETFQNYVRIGGDVCAVKPDFANPQSYKLIPRSEIDNFFKKGQDGWKKFYAEHPKSAGFWQMSRPGYNSLHDEAMLYLVHSCGWLCGTGHLYLFSKQAGQWKVMNSVMLWIS